jgi:hypothetical protein
MAWESTPHVTFKLLHSCHPALLPPCNRSPTLSFSHSAPPPPHNHGPCSFPGGFGDVFLPSRSNLMWLNCMLGPAFDAKALPSESATRVHFVCPQAVWTSDCELFLVCHIASVCAVLSKGVSHAVAPTSLGKAVFCVSSMHAASLASAIVHAAVRGSSSDHL